MKIFEFAFNPKKSRNRFFEVFSYEPKSPREKPKGSLYIIGELENALELHSKFLRRLSTLIQHEYYISPLKGTTPALKAALKKTNAFLQEESKRGNVDWLGNLHLAVLLFVTVKEKKTVFHVAKTGTIQVYLAHQTTLVDMTKNLAAVSPGRVFDNLVSGKVVPGDNVLILTKEIFDLFTKEQSLAEFGMFNQAKQFREFFSKRQRILSQSSGVLFSFVIEQEMPRRSSPNKSLLLLLPTFPKPKLMLPVKLSSVKFNLTELSLPRLQLPWQRNPAAFKKQSILVFLLFVILLLGALLFS